MYVASVFVFACACACACACECVCACVCMCVHERECVSVCACAHKRGAANYQWFDVTASSMHRAVQYRRSPRLQQSATTSNIGQYAAFPMIRVRVCVCVFTHYASIRSCRQMIVAIYQPIHGDETTQTVDTQFRTTARRPAAVRSHCCVVAGSGNSSRVPKPFFQAANYFPIRKSFVS